jgi:polysaccharide biosynthesis protein PslG
MQRLALLLAACLSLALPLAGHAQGNPDAALSPFGYSCDNQTTYTLETYLPQMAAAGIRWIRGFPTANVLAPEQGRYDWSAADRFMATADANGMHVSGLLFYMPPWIASDEVKLPVRDLPGWDAYVSSVVGRYKGRVKVWEVWNETPNFIGAGTAADYAQTVVHAYDAAKAVDPDCQIMLSIQSNNVQWIDQVLQAGAAGHYDIIAVHPYETLGLVEACGFEAEFAGIVPTLRKLLAARDPGRQDVPIWFTEVGYDAGEGEIPQASALVKAFCLSLAQGVERVDWFEGMDGDSGPMGLLRADRSPRLAYTAMANLTRCLGPAPEYQGWVLLNGTGYGFAFEGAEGSVMALWAAPGATDRVSLPPGTRLLDPLTGASAEAGAVTLTSVPLLVVGVPEDLLAQARANRDRPLAWRGDLEDYGQAASAYLTAGAPNVERGLHQLNADASSSVVQAYGVTARDCGKGAGQAFTVDRRFVSYDSEPITVTVVARRNAANDNAGFNLKYESTTGIHGTGGWYTIPGNDRWYTQSWTLMDAQFVGKWGYNFSLDSDVPTSYLLRSVTVSRAR